MAKMADLTQLVTALVSGPWLEIVARAWKLGKKLWRGWAEEGMYEVLEYEVTLELKDKQGKRAIHRKRERVRYLQDNIIAYQDQAWGDGDFLVNYRCTPGKEVDRYQSGYKTQILISLQETKEKGDTDEFRIEREIHNGHLNATEYAEIEISHRTKQFAMQVIFPKARPPHRPILKKRLRKEAVPLSQEHIRQLPDGRWLLWWSTTKPRLYEHYLLQWDW